MKVLIVGLGKIARTHIDALRKNEPGCQLLALRSKNGNPGMEGVTDIYSVDDIPRDIDFIIVSNPTAFHASAISALIDLGKPFFIEKPVFESDEHQDVIKEITKRGIKTYVGCNLRFYDLLLFLRKHLIEHPEHRVNEVNAYCGAYLPLYRQGEDYRLSYNARIAMGGGIHIDMIHDIDYTLWLFGRPLDMSAVFRNASSLGIEAPDYAHYTLIYPGFTATVTLNYYRTSPRRTLEIVFDDTVWLADMRAGTIIDSEGRTVYRSRNTVADTYEAQMRYFIEAIAAGKSLENDAAEAFETLKYALGQRVARTK